MTRRWLSCSAVGVLALTGLHLQAQARGPRLFTDALPPGEFAERRAKVVDQIGDAIAIVQGAAEYPAFVKFRQNNQFFYLTGVEVPRAVVVIDGQSRQTTLFLPPRNERMERSEGPLLVPDEDAVRLTGIADVRPSADLAALIDRIAVEQRPIYTAFRMESLGAGTPDRTGLHAAATAADPWDRRPSREDVFRAHLKARAPACEIRDLDPILDRLRVIKSPREVALIREASRIASEAILEAMRSAHVGMKEYELEAIGDYVFKQHGAFGPSYFGLVATGTNSYYPHYHAAQDTLVEGDLVLYDYAPDYKYYASDVTREFPANGRFSPDQKELYTIYLHLYQALMRAIRPGASPSAILADAVRTMEAIVAAYPFTKPAFRGAAERFVNDHRAAAGRMLGHFLGMEVHDVSVPIATLEPGMVFTIEPALTIPEDRIYIRLEDPIVITASGYENLSAALPVEIADIERVMAEPGRFERRSPGTASAR